MAKNNDFTEVAEDATSALPAQDEVLMNEDELLRGLLEAAEFSSNEQNHTKIVIKRKGKALFEFRIAPLSEEEVNVCRKKATKYMPNPAGKHLPRVEADTDYVRMRSYKIYEATIPEDRAKLWDNKVVKDRLGVLQGIDVIDLVLMAGEKSWVCDAIDELSGFNAQNVTLEDYAKN